MFNSYTFLNCIAINIFDMIAISKMYYMYIWKSLLMHCLNTSEKYSLFNVNEIFSFIFAGEEF